MTVRRWHWGIALSLSAATHVAAMGLLFEPPRQAPKEQGNGSVTVVVVGQSMADMLAEEQLAPKTSDDRARLEPVSQNRPVLEPTETSRLDAVPPGRRDAAEAVEPAQTPSRTTAQSPMAAAAPARVVNATPAEAMTARRVTETIEATVRSPSALAHVPPRQIIEGAEPVALPVPQPRPANLVPPRRQQVARAEPQGRQTQRQRPSRQEQGTRPARSATPAPARSRSTDARQSAQPSPAKQATGQRNQQTANATATTRAGQRAVANYPGKVARKLRRSLRYPRDARRQGVTGQAQVRFTIRANGQAGSIRLARSSGSAFSSAREMPWRSASAWPETPPPWIRAITS